MSRSKVLILTLINIVIFFGVLKISQINKDLSSGIAQRQHSIEMQKVAQKELPGLRERVAGLESALNNTKRDQSFSSIVDAMASLTYILDEESIVPVSLSQNTNGENGSLTVVLREDFKVLVSFMEKLVNGEKLYRIRDISMRNTSQGLVTTMTFEVNVE